MVVMVLLRRDQILLWKRQLKHKTGESYLDPDLAFVSRYVCYWCDKIFYYKMGDKQTPQYGETEDGTRPFCHKCFHYLKLKNGLSRSGCWLCDLQRAIAERKARLVRDQAGEENPYIRKNGREPERTPKKSKQGGVRRRAVLSS